MNAVFNRWLPCLTLGVWSTVLLAFHFSGRINRLLTPDFRTYAFIAGIVLGLMALAFAIFRADASCCSSAECGHSLSRLASGRMLSFLILILPITVAAMVTPATFSGTTVQNRGIVEDASLLGAKRKVERPPDLALPVKESSPVAVVAATPVPVESNPSPDTAGQPPAPAEPAAATAATTPEPTPGDYLTRTPEGVIVAEVLDLLYAAQDNVLRKDFEDKEVELVGQFMPDKTSANQGKRFKAVRMFMYCCAADSRPIATLIEADPLPEMAEMTWVKIKGISTFPLENGRRVSVIRATKVEKTEPPSEAMLY